MLWFADAAAAAEAMEAAGFGTNQHVIDEAGVHADIDTTRGLTEAPDNP